MNKICRYCGNPVLDNYLVCSNHYNLIKSNQLSKLKLRQLRKLNTPEPTIVDKRPIRQLRKLNTPEPTIVDKRPIRLKELTPGFVYIILNRNYPGWSKVGITVNLEGRLTNYQTCSPHRDYFYYFSCKSYSRRKVEALVLKELKTIGRVVNEWTDVKPSIIKELVQKHNTLR